MANILLPNIQRVEIHNFSLYAENPVIMDFTKAAACIMGANGIGKSTLLNCINFAITGRINQPNKKIRSIETLDNGNNHHLEYFDGRIVESDKDYATIKATFSIGDSLVEVKRSFFPDNTIIEYKLDGVDREINEYENDVVRISKLSNYAQFVFLQLKVLTFDEGRDCLFWNPSILTPTIFLCLGQNVDNADKADDLSRKLQKINSRIRNVQWEITKQTTRLTTLIEERNKAQGNRTNYQEEDEASAKNDYEELVKEIDEIIAKIEGYKKEQQQLYAQITEMSVERIRLEKEYEDIYKTLYSDGSFLSQNPLIRELIADGCPICHTKHQDLPQRIQKCMEEKTCPLCGERVAEIEVNQEDIIQKLAAKDAELLRVTKALEERVLRQKHVDEQVNSLSSKVEALQKRRSEIEEKRYSFLQNDESEGSWAERIKALQDSIKSVEDEKGQHIAERDSVKQEYDQLCHDLEHIYRKVQIDFLPIFKKFAKKFTGLDLDMNLTSVTEDGRRLFKFILQIDDTSRDNEFELSESQRFFIDIALRMAIVDYVCSSERISTTMLIDTPEGSLDIAYETNAGSMFSEYIDSHQKMIITANLNSSGLIRTLANNTKASKFALINMLKWAKLSSVQSSLFELFQNAISEIEKCLGE